jgi:Regulator of ribonuclease activity B
MIFPNDANGDALGRMEAQGDDLTRPRNVDFNVVFPDAGAAEEFSKHFRALGHEVSVEATETDQDFPWNVVVVKHMMPTYDGIGTFENLLQSVANRWGGITMAGVVSPGRPQPDRGGWPGIDLKLGDTERYFRAPLRRLDGLRWPLNSPLSSLST